MILNHDLSFQMFASHAAATLDQQIKLLADLGYTYLQPIFFAPPDQPVDANVDLLQTYGMTAQFGHFTLNPFTAHPDMVQDIATKFGMKLVVCPRINPLDRPTAAKGSHDVGRWFAAITKDIAARGPTFACHHHEFEMAPLPDGTYHMVHLLGGTAPFEPDLAWMVVGGADLLIFLYKYKGHVPAVHVKDRVAPGTSLDEKGFAGLGHGVMDWQTPRDASVGAGAQLMVVKHDLPRDWTRFARWSIKDVRRIGGASA